MQKTVFISVVVFFSLRCIQASGQKIGIGAQFGEPTGLTVRVNSAGNINLDMLAAWNFDNYFFFNLHGVWEKRVINDFPKFHYFYGPGAFVVLRNRGHNYTDEASLGISGTIGLNVYLGRVEVFGQVTPRLTLVKSTDGYIGGGIGGRFYLN
jgi:hypothetical protein